MSDEHAKLSPSGADRWVNCTASVDAEKGLPDKSSVYAEEGTEAHSLLEKSLIAKQAPGATSPGHPSAKDVNVAFEYVYKRLYNDRYIVLPETKVELTPDIWGTADIIVIDTKAGHIEIIDYKHGMGVGVESDCLQLMIYGAAAVKTVAWMMDKPVKMVTTTIVQPRKPHDEGPIRSTDYTIEGIQSGAQMVIDAAKKIRNGDTVFKPSEKACQWCKAKGNCKAFADAALDSIGAYFTPVGCLEVPDKDAVTALTVEQKGAILEARGLIKAFMAAIEDDVETTILAGGSVPGFKMVAGRSNRQWAVTEEEVHNFCKNVLKMKVGEFTKQTLLGPAPVEKFLKELQRGGKAKLELLEAKIEKPEGKPTIVPESDKRPAIQPLFQAINPLD